MSLVTYSEAARFLTDKQVGGDHKSWVESELDRIDDTIETSFCYQPLRYNAAKTYTTRGLGYDTIVLPFTPVWAVSAVEVRIDPTESWDAVSSSQWALDSADGVYRVYRDAGFTRGYQYRITLEHGYSDTDSGVSGNATETTPAAIRAVIGEMLLNAWDQRRTPNRRFGLKTLGDTNVQGIGASTSFVAQKELEAMWRQRLAPWTIMRP